MNSWLDRLRPASFRGVPFFVESSSQSAGRRLVKHEYPDRDASFVEDLGQTAWDDSMNVFVLGNDHLLQAERLIAALNQRGHGELIHPYLGSKSVYAGEVSIQHSSTDGGLSRFQIKWLEYVAPIAPTQNINSAVQLSGSCSQAQGALDDEFCDQFYVGGLSQGLTDGLADSWEDSQATLGITSEQAPLETLPALATVKAKTPSGLTTTALLTDPTALVENLKKDVDQLLGLGHGATPTVERILNTLKRLPKVEATRLNPPYKTPSRLLQVECQGQLLNLLYGTVLISSATASSKVSYQDSKQANEVKQLFLSALEVVELSASDLLYRMLMQVKVDMLADLSGRGAGLPSVNTIEQTRTLPALVQAYALYQDAARSDELINRNNLEHPSFIPIGTLLEVIK